MLLKSRKNYFKKYYLEKIKPFREKKEPHREVLEVLKKGYKQPIVQQKNLNVKGKENGNM